MGGGGEALRGYRGEEESEDRQLELVDELGDCLLVFDVEDLWLSRALAACIRRRRRRKTK